MNEDSLVVLILWVSLILFNVPNKSLYSSDPSSCALCTYNEEWKKNLIRKHCFKSTISQIGQRVYPEIALYYSPLHLMDFPFS